MAVNIGKANEGDAFYRYKMPALQSKVRPALLWTPPSGTLRTLRRKAAAASTCGSLFASEDARRVLELPPVRLVVAAPCGGLSLLCACRGGERVWPRGRAYARARLC